MAILERYNQMEELHAELKDLVKYETERDELTSEEISALEDTQGLMEDIGSQTDDKIIQTWAEKINGLAHKILVLVSTEYCKVRGIESACTEGR